MLGKLIILLQQPLNLGLQKLNASKRCRWNGKQWRPWLKCSSRSILIWVYTVCLVLYMSENLGKNNSNVIFTPACTDQGVGSQCLISLISQGMGFEMVKLCDTSPHIIKVLPRMFDLHSCFPSTECHGCLIFFHTVMDLLCSLCRQCRKLCLGDQTKAIPQIVKGWCVSQRNRLWWKRLGGFECEHINTASYKPEWRWRTRQHGGICYRWWS